MKRGRKGRERRERKKGGILGKKKNMHKKNGKSNECVSNEQKHQELWNTKL